MNHQSYTTHRGQHSTHPPQCPPPATPALPARPATLGLLPEIKSLLWSVSLSGFKAEGHGGREEKIGGAFNG